MRGDSLYLIGGLGYYGKRRYGRTPVYKLDLATYKITPLETKGDNPGWIHEHRATRISQEEIRLTDGIALEVDEKDYEKAKENKKSYILDVETLVWRREE